ncbi:MAG: OsmC family protein [Planctomycetia bacterium]|nr:OsmC family protein [Planctomycetia bacterium]
MGERVTCRTVGGHRVEATNGASSTFIDLPKVDGGEGNGLGPHETLLAALGACTSMTLQVYAARKQWPLEGVELTLTREKAAVGVPDAKDRIGVEIRVHGPLDAAQRAKLLEIAQKCPVYKTLTSDLDVVETLA